MFLPSTWLNYEYHPTHLMENGSNLGTENTTIKFPIKASNSHDCDAKDNVTENKEAIKNSKIISDSSLILFGDSNLNE